MDDDIKLSPMDLQCYSVDATESCVTEVMVDAAESSTAMDPWPAYKDYFEFMGYGNLTGRKVKISSAGKHSVSYRCKQHGCRSIVVASKTSSSNLRRHYEHNHGREKLEEMQEAVAGHRTRKKRKFEDTFKVSIQPKLTPIFKPKIRKVCLPLSDHVAIVTGASSGIGQATAMALAAAGARVALAARRAYALEDTVKTIIERGGEAIGVTTDVTDRGQVKDLVRHVESSLGPVTILVNCAGVMYYTMMKNLHEDEWERQIDVNCKGVMHGIGAVLDGMIKRGKGHIVNISSDAGRKGFAGLAVYSGTKFFVEGMSQALRQEVAGTGVKVTCIQPGDVKTSLLTHSTDKEATDLYDGSSKVQILEPGDVAEAIVYAVSQPRHVGVNEILIEPREAPV